MLTFNKSSPYTLGIELELQLINSESFDLTPFSERLLERVKNKDFPGEIKPEITKSMIEINSSANICVNKLYTELIILRDFLVNECDELNIGLSGGGTHPFQKWHERQIFPKARYEALYNEYNFLAKKFTTFGQHVHIGCQNSEDAIYLIHSLSRFIPHLIAISASSPFYEGVNTDFNSSRGVLISSFPLSGNFPFVSSWEEYNDYLEKIHLTKSSTTNLNDFYWDIRPNADFGTVEVRICDTPLSLEKAVIIAAFLQALSSYLLNERPFNFHEDPYFFYIHNRFQACRHGFSATLVDAQDQLQFSLQDDLVKTLSYLKSYAEHFNSSQYLAEIYRLCKHNLNDSKYLMELYNKDYTLNEIIQNKMHIFKYN